MWVAGRPHPRSTNNPTADTVSRSWSTPSTDDQAHGRISSPFGATLAPALIRTCHQTLLPTGPGVLFLDSSPASRVEMDPRRTRVEREELPPTMVMIFVAHSSHIGQVLLLLRDQVPPPALFLNLDVAHASSEEIPERGFDSNLPWPPPEPSRWEGRRRPLSMVEYKLKLVRNKSLIDFC